jgi:hypothetical protein
MATPLAGVTTAAAIIAGFSEAAITPPVASIVTAIVTALGVLVVTRLKSSGRIATTEAGQLWTAAEKMRDEMHEQLVEQRADMAGLRSEIASLRAEHESCLANLTQMRVALNAAGITKETP